MDYLERFAKKLERRWKGSLIRVAEAERIEPNAKKYLGQLADRGEVEKVTWGWYWLPYRYKDFFDFLAKDKNFKVLEKQGAAAFWNGDFLHRDYFVVGVKDKSYGKALEEFARSKGWKVSVEVRGFTRSEYTASRGVYVESLEETIVDCVKDWAFTDAFSSLYENRDRVNRKKLFERSWERVRGSSARVGQILKYGASILERETGIDKNAESRAEIQDDFIRRQVEEAVEKVVAFA